METYLYFSMTPESLIASMLPPEEFGAYMASGTAKRSHGEAIFFDLKPDFQSDYFDLSTISSHCVAHSDGQPKHSVYVSIYRVIEHIPLTAIQSLWLTTRDGRVLQLEAGDISTVDSGIRYHLYQELCPVRPMIASSLNPRAFCEFITDSSNPIYLPRICFADMSLGGIADDPVKGSAKNLPYKDIDHIRDCLQELETKSKNLKTVNRTPPQEIPYRCIRNGFYLGDHDGIVYFPFPSAETLDVEHHEWWRSANL